MPRRKARKDLCGNPDCQSSGLSKVVCARERCAACYQEVRRLIAAGVVASWQEAEQLGMVAKPHPGGRPTGRSRFPDIVNMRRERIGGR